MKTFRFFFLCIIISFWGCKTDSVFMDFHEIEDGWNKDEVVEFSFPISDPAAHNLFVYLHTNHAYPFSNLYLITELTTPEQQVFTDTLEFEMTTAEGFSLGTGWLDVKEHKLWCYENLAMNQEGTYSFRVRQSMRLGNAVEKLENLQGVLDVGLEVQRID